MSEAFKPAPIKPNISFAELDRIDIRVGQIVKVAEVEGSEGYGQPVAIEARTACTPDRRCGDRCAIWHYD